MATRIETATPKHAFPSGHLTDTFAVNFDAYPSSENFNESDLYVEYQEDIFVGYRYFETIPGAAEKVCYPFGYGLTYTTFAMTDAKLTVGEQLSVTAKVTNTGKLPGKQVAQLYVQAPQGKLGKASRVLVGFAKTQLLQPGESETVTITFGRDRIASFDDVGCVAADAYVLEAGSPGQAGQGRPCAGGLCQDLAAAARRERDRDHHLRP